MWNGNQVSVVLMTYAERYSIRHVIDGFSRRGLAEASGDLVVLTEPDGTFLPGDIFMLLVYSDDCDAVFGTRTTPQLVWSGANMPWFLRWGNWGVAKLVEALFNTRHLSNVGCTYRLFKRNSPHTRPPP